MNEYINAFRNYTEFKGRSTRRDYWTFSLISILISLLLSILDAYIGWPANRFDRGAAAGNVLSDIYSVLVFIPSLAITVRRIHDAGRSGWCSLIPIYSFYLTLLPSDTSGDNPYTIKHE